MCGGAGGTRERDARLRRGPRRPSEDAETHEGASLAETKGTHGRSRLALAIQIRDSEPKIRHKIIFNGIDQTELFVKCFSHQLGKYERKNIRKVSYNYDQARIFDDLGVAYVDLSPQTISEALPSAKRANYLWR